MVQTNTNMAPLSTSTWTDTKKSRVNRRKPTKNLCVLIEFFTRNSAMYGTSTSHQILPQCKHCKLVLRFSQLSLFYEKQTVKMQLVPQFLSYRVRTGLIR